MFGTFGTFADKPWAKALTTLVLAILTAVGAGIANGGVEDIDTRGWVGIILVILGGTALTQLVDNFGVGVAGIMKALIGAATAGLTAWTVAYENEVPAQYVISQGEWLTIAIAVISALSVVYQVNEAGDNTVAVVDVDDRPVTRGNR